MFTVNTLVEIVFTERPVRTVVPPVWVILLANVAVPATPSVPELDVPVANKLFVEIELVEMLLAVIKLVLTVPPTLRPPESISEPTVSVVM